MVDEVGVHLFTHIHILSISSGDLANLLKSTQSAQMSTIILYAFLIKNMTFWSSGFPALHFPNIAATGCRSSHIIATEERRLDWKYGYVLSLLDAGVWRLNLGGQNPPPYYLRYF